MSPVRTAELAHRRLALLGLASSLGTMPSVELPNPSAREVPVPSVVRLPSLPTAGLPTKPPNPGKRR